MCCFCHRQHLFRLDKVAQFGFPCKPYQYDQSCHCPVWFLSQLTPSLIGHYSSVSFLAYIELVRSVTFFSYLAFIIDYNRFYWSQQLSIIFGVDCTCTIGHIIVLLVSSQTALSPISHNSLVSFLA